jgi:glycosyltransferase involved in cell wall biosynthesis
VHLPAEANVSVRLVCVGRLCEQKAQLLLVEATRQLLDRRLAVELVLAGDGEMRPQIEARARALNLGAALRITGWISSAQVRDEILQARALVLPSYAEGLPVVLMEAMALARPVISTYVAGIPELVHVPECGWLVPAGDVRALTDAMADCLTMPVEGLRKMGAQARARALARHDIDIEAAKLVSLFRGNCRPAEA